MNTKENPSYSRSRTRQTIKFCEIPEGVTVLDIAAPNMLSREMADKKSISVINTVSDLDYEITPDSTLLNKFDYVTCFEVIEHLLNPRLFFDNLHNVTTDNAVVYLSYPSRYKWLWNDQEHFHEYDKQRFKYLLDKTGWAIVESKSIYVRRNPFGIRPIIRNFLPQTGIYKLIKR